MEFLLNLLWLVAVVLLFAATMRTHRRGQLRCSLPLALGCVALLAMVLFPALSMTDDLQRSRLDTESMGRHLGDVLQLGSLEDAEHSRSPASCCCCGRVAWLRRDGSATIRQCCPLRRRSACSLKRSARRLRWHS